jgi:hypothetical protein
MIGSDRRSGSSRPQHVPAAGLAAALASLLLLPLTACGTSHSGPAAGGASSPSAVTSPGGAATLELPIAGKNLIVNGDAEAAPGTDGDSVAVDVPGWARTGEFTAVAYDTAGDGNYPTPKDPGPPDRGRNFFAGGPNAERSGAVQTIDGSQVGSALDSGRVGYTLSAWLGGYRGQDDQVQLAAQFLSAAGGVLATASLPAVVDADRAGRTALLLRTTGGSVPPGTRRIRVDMEMIRKAGSANDGYADDLALVLNAAA